MSFPCSKSSRSSPSIIIAGFPLEDTVSFRKGTAEGPAAFREDAEKALEYYSMAQEKSLCDISFFDAGDIELSGNNINEKLHNIENYAVKVISEGNRLAALGGEHLITLPLVRALTQKKSDISLLQLDAHADLRHYYDGQVYSHATVMHHCLEAGIQHLYQLGIRSCTENEHRRMKTDSAISLLNTPEDLSKKINPGNNLYITIDMDYFDPSFVPGTGTPESGGASFHDIINVFKILSAMKIKILGADITELAPHIDPTGRSTVFAQKLLRELLMVFSE